MENEKGIQYVPAKLDNRLSEAVQDFRRSHNVYRENHKKLESGNDNIREELSWDENLERDLPGGVAMTINTCDSDDATQWNN